MARPPSDVEDPEIQEIIEKVDEANKSSVQKELQKLQSEFNAFKKIEESKARRPAHTHAVIQKAEREKIRKMREVKRISRDEIKKLLHFDEFLKVARSKKLCGANGCISGGISMTRRIS